MNDIRIKEITERLIWIDENVAPDNVDYDIYMDEVSQLEDEKIRLNIEKNNYVDPSYIQNNYYTTDQSGQLISPHSKLPLTSEQNNLIQIFDQIRSIMGNSYNCNYQFNKRQDNLTTQTFDLIHLAKMFGMDELSNILNSEFIRIVEKFDYQRRREIEYHNRMYYANNKF